MATVKERGCIVALDKDKGGKCQRWQLRVSTGWNPVKSKYDRRTKVVHGTRSQAEKALRALVKEVESGMEADGHKMTFAAFALEWQQRRVRSKELSLGQLRKDDLHVRTLNQYLGPLKLARINARIIDQTFLKLKNGGSLKGKDLSGTTCNCLFITLKQIMQEAVRYDYIACNPCDKVKAPKRDTSEKQALLPGQVKVVNDRLMSERPSSQAVAVALALNTGMRRGEVCGLTWGDVSFAQDDQKEVPTIQVNHSLAADGKQLKEPKSRSGKRIIPVDRAFADYLASWKRAQAFELAEWGMEQSDDTPVVTSEVGGFMHPENFERWWRRNRAKYGLESFTLHGFRHTYASVLIGSGADPKSVQSLIGHADAAFTMGIYTHSNIANEITAAQRFGSVLYGDDDTPQGALVVRR